MNLSGLYLMKVHVHVAKTNCFKPSLFVKNDHYPTHIFCPEISSVFLMSAACIPVHIRQDFIIETNTINLDPIVPLNAVLSGPIVLAV